MHFDRLRTVGAAVAAGAIMAVASSGAQATTAWYSNAPTIPQLMAEIDDTSYSFAYTVTLSTSMGTADYLGFGFNWTGGGDPLQLSDFTVKSAYSPPGSVGGASITPSTLNVQLCGDGSIKVSKCGSNANNFNGGGSATNFDYIFAIGTPGTGTDYVDEVTFTIGTPVEPDLANSNPFSQLAARAQTTLDADGNEAGDEGSLKSDLVLCSEPMCGGGTGQEDPAVPEISATGSVAALGSVLALMAFLLERRGGVSMRRRSVA